MKRLHFLIITIPALFYLACKPDNTVTIVDESLENIPYNPQGYTVTVPAGFPQLEIPADNPLTVDGIDLGRRLFYDPILSADSSMACATCHAPAGNFTDNKALSKGIDGLFGTRSSMTLENVGFFKNGLFWDGRVSTLEEQAIKPVENPIELHDDWTNIETKLRRHADYPTRFRKAFGISKKSEITRDLAAKAIAQFERTMVSSGTSRFDLALTPGSGVFFTEQEQNGYNMFFQLNGAKDAQCGHCHSGPLISSNNYFNNGLDSAATLNDFPDPGRGKITGNINENGKFRAPSLRNITKSAPYMHDGRFQTLEQVVDHYNAGGKYSENIDPFLIQLKNHPLTAQEKMDLIVFLKTFTDTVFINNPAFKNPF